jgi:hypothetical protein
MSNPLSASAPAVVQEYYRILTAGAPAYGQGESLRRLLSDHLDFTVTGLEVVAEVHDDRGSAVLYDAGLPGGTVRFAEFFTIADGRIAALHLHYDGPDYLSKGGR